MTIGEVALVFDGPHATPKTVDAGPIFLGISALQDGRINLGETRHVTPEDFRTWTRRVKPQADDVVFSYETRIGQAAIIPHGFECCLGRRMGLVRVDKSRLEPRFFLYFYISTPFQEFLRSRTIHGATVDRLALTEFPSFPIPVPPLAEQQNLASILGALDDKIELNRRMNETLEAMARALFKDWFVDFGPTRAKQAGMEPYLAPELWSQFPERLDAEGKPEGWEHSTIGQEVDVVGGGTPSTKEATYWDGDVSWVTPKDLSSLSAPVLLETSRKITMAGLEKISSGLLSRGTVLLSSRAPIGYLAITEIPVAVNQGFIAMRCEGRLSNAFVWLWTLANMDAILQKANGSTFQEINKKSFRPLPVVVPGEEALRRFTEIAGSLYARIAANELESRTLAQTRDLLLPKLMSGEIRVKDAEKTLEAQ